MILLRIAAHVLLLAGPIVIAGKGAALREPKGIACIALLLLLSEIENALASTERDDRDLKTVPCSGRGNPTAIASGIALLLIAWLSIASLAITSSIHESGSWLGACVVLLGILLRGLAIADLGPHFSSAIEPSSPELRINGIYGALRHPSELGLFLISIGLSVLTGSILAAYVIAILLIPSIMVRIVREERALSARFGDLHRTRPSWVRVVLGTLRPR